MSLPVNADGEKGYGDEAGVKETVRAFVGAGVAGMNLEDSIAKGGSGLVELAQQLRKIKAVMDTKRELGSEFFLNARVDSFHVMTNDPKKALDEAIRRGNAYAEAGGDCIFYLGLHSAETIGTVAKEVKAPDQYPCRTAVAERERVARSRRGAGELRFGLHESGDHGEQKVGPGNFGKRHVQPIERRRADAGD